MNILFSDPLLVVAAVIGIMSLVLVFLLIEYYKKLKDTQFVSEVMNVSEKKESVSKTSSAQQISVSDQPEQKPDGRDKIETPNINNSDIVLAQLNELANQINSINNNFKDLNIVIKNLSSATPQNTGLTEKHIEKLLTTLQHIETIVSSQPKSTNDDKESLAEINAKLDNILKILSAILQQ